MNYFNYFTEIEDHFLRRRGKSLMVSPMDWSLISTWRDSGVPLHVALRGIDIAMDKFYSGKRRASERPGTLFYCHDAVMAEYARHLEAHLGEESTPSPDGEAVLAGNAGHSGEQTLEEGPTQDQIVTFLRRRISEIKEMLEKHFLREGSSEGIARVVSRLEEIAESLTAGSRVEPEALERDLGILDNLLTEELRPEISTEEMTEWEKAAKKELKLYKKRLPKETYERIHVSFIRGKIHRKYDLGELSLFHL
jgi:hypothetical protein